MNPSKEHICLENVVLAYLGQNEKRGPNCSISFSVTFWSYDNGHNQINAKEAAKLTRKVSCETYIKTMPNRSPKTGEAWDSINEEVEELSGKKIGGVYTGGEVGEQVN